MPLHIKDDAATEAVRKLARVEKSQPNRDRARRL